MAAPVSLTRIQLMNNPAPFCDPIQMQITFDSVTADLQHELEFKVIYVRDPCNDSLDITLDSLFVGPVQKGRSMFVVEIDPPSLSDIPVKNRLDVTALLFTGNYQGEEFVRVGYYVSNDLKPEKLAQAERQDLTLEEVCAKLDASDLIRTIGDDKPTVTKYEITWDLPRDSEVQRFLKDNEAMGQVGLDDNAPAMPQRSSSSSSTLPANARVEEDEDGEEDEEEEDDEDEASEIDLEADSGAEEEAGETGDAGEAMSISVQQEPLEEEEDLEEDADE
jgi:histone chaperone ASF1